MNLARIARHLLFPPWQLHRLFPRRVLAAIERTVAETEATHEGQIRFAIEASLHPGLLLRGQSARARAVDVFSQLRVWDTGRNNGVLVYLLLADHKVEIIADRGVHKHVGTTEWERICHTMEERFRTGRFEEGVIGGIRAVGEHLARHYPGSGSNPNELPDKPVIL
jgi:uncharacterized membrane protein